MMVLRLTKVLEKKIAPHPHPPYFLAIPTPQKYLCVYILYVEVTSTNSWNTLMLTFVGTLLSNWNNGNRNYTQSQTYNYTKSANHNHPNAHVIQEKGTFKANPNQFTYTLLSIVLHPARRYLNENQPDNTRKVSTDRTHRQR